jgi:hypothetical protein
MSVGLMNQICPVTPIVLLMAKKNRRGAHAGAQGKGWERNREKTVDEGVHLQAQGSDGGQDTDSIIQGASVLPVLAKLTAHVTERRIRIDVPVAMWVRSPIHPHRGSLC